MSKLTKHDKYDLEMYFHCQAILHSVLKVKQGQTQALTTLISHQRYNAVILALGRGDLVHNNFLASRDSSDRSTRCLQYK